MKLIAISGFARCGKDTFVSIAQNILIKNGYTPFRIAFADKMKFEVISMLKKNGFKLDILNLSPEEKEKIRPLFVFWGCQRRSESPGGLYWVDYVDDYLINLKSDYIKGGSSDEKLVPLISDLRFPNEAEWVHNKKGHIIHLKKYTKILENNGLSIEKPLNITKYKKIYSIAPNIEETTNDPLIYKIADQRIEWEDKGNVNLINNIYLNKTVLNTLNNSNQFSETLIL